MTESYQSWESSTPVNKNNNNGTAEVDARGVPYIELNRQVRELAREGARHIILKGVRGQRYLGTRLPYPDLFLEVHGIPGEDLAFNLDGPTVEVFGHAQNAAANTMDRGKLIIHGLAGDALAYGMRGGKVFVRDDVGYRVGIHMKEYGDQLPVLVIGGTAGDYLGEYMAGGTIILLNRHHAESRVAGNSARTLATGIHGGKIYIFGYRPTANLLGIGASLEEVPAAEREQVENICREFCTDFLLDAEPLLNRDLFKVEPRDSRPFASFYYPAYPTNTGLKPEHREGVSPCEANCPAGIPTGRFLRLLRKGEREEALRLVGEYTPLRFSCCGFICPHLCMENCTRGQVDLPVRTTELARHFRSHLPPAPEDKRVQEIAVIGAGPAGLSAAHQLMLRGYRVTVFDEADHPGGKLYQVISPTRLPREVLQQDLDNMKKAGINFVLNTRVDQQKLDQLLEQYHHVIVAVGTHEPVIPPVKGSERIRGGLDFLKEFNQGDTLLQADGRGIGPYVVIIGGGDAAIDGLEACLELHADPFKITVIDIQKPAAAEEERRKMEDKGVNFRYPLFLQEVTEEGVVVKNQREEIEFIPADTVLSFINERPCLDFLPDEVNSNLVRGFFQSPRENSFRTAHPQISVVGDAAEPGLVTTNLGRGRRCALEVHALQQGEEYIPEVKEEATGSPYLMPQKASPLDERDINIEEEFHRCLHCGICVQCDECIEACPRQALSRDENTSDFHVDLTQCGGCGTCAYTCLGGVIHMTSR